MNQTGATSSSAAPIALLSKPLTACLPADSAEIELETESFLEILSFVETVFSAFVDSNVLVLELFHAPHDPEASDSAGLVWFVAAFHELSHPLE